MCYELVNIFSLTLKGVFITIVVIWHHHISLNETLTVTQHIKSYKTHADKPSLNVLLKHVEFCECVKMIKIDLTWSNFLQTSTSQQELWIFIVWNQNYMLLVKTNDRWSISMILSSFHHCYKITSNIKWHKGTLCVKLEVVTHYIEKC